MKDPVMQAYIETIYNEISTIIDEQKRLEALHRTEILRARYDGEDRVISSHDMALEIANDPQANFEIKWKYNKLDIAFGSLKPGDLIVVSAPTKSGKTTWCQNLTENFLDQGFYTQWFSYEIPFKQLIEKFSEPMPLFYIPRKLTGNTIEWVEKRIVEGIAKYDTRVVVIDHLHRILNLASANRLDIQIADVMGKLKQIAMQNNIVIFVICHLKKTKFETPPTTDDLRDSSFIAQEADLVCLLYREWDSQAMGHTNKTSIILQANRRTGEEGYFDVEYNREQRRFYEI